MLLLDSLWRIFSSATDLNKSTTLKDVHSDDLITSPIGRVSAALNPHVLKQFVYVSATPASNAI